MDERGKPEGLCTTCVCFPDCTYHKERGLPVLYCDEFSDTGPCKKTEIRSKVDSSYRGSSTGRKESLSSEEGYAEGLCVNCGLRESCLFKKPEGGVWHCEEYC